MTRREISRRQALTMLGAAGVGAAVLGACGSDGDDAATATSSSSSSTTGAGSASSSTTATTGGSAGSAATGAVTRDAFQSAGSCMVTPEQTEGPYYIDVDNVRSDIREDRQGTPLRVAARVVDTDGCTPVKDAVFEIWHCDAGGVYSGFGSAPQERFLRGAQVTNADGIAEITTVYPGWYQGRAVHIHAKVHLNNREALTTQFYFDDSVSDTVFVSAPYTSRTGNRTRNSSDGIYRRETMLTVSKYGDGYLGLITIGISA